MQQIHDEAEDNVAISRSDANSLIPSIESAYYGLLIKGNYLPKLTSSIITAEYLLGVLFDQIYVPRVQDVKMGTLLRSVKKYEILEELQKQNIGEDLIWAIDQKHQPDKLWAINVLKTLSPENPLFSKYEPEQFDMKQFTQEQILKIKNLDLTQGKKSSVRRFFRVSKDKQLEIQQKRKLEQNKQLKKKIFRKTLAIQQTQQEIQEIGARIQQH